MRPLWQRPAPPACASPRRATHLSRTHHQKLVGAGTRRRFARTANDGKTGKMNNNREPFPEFQRDSARQPWVATQELPLVMDHPLATTPTGLRHHACLMPVGLISRLARQKHKARLPRVVLPMEQRRAVQPGGLADSSRGLSQAIPPDHAPMPSAPLRGARYWRPIHHQLRGSEIFLANETKWFFKLRQERHRKRMNHALSQRWVSETVRDLQLVEK